MRNARSRRSARRPFRRAKRTRKTMYRSRRSAKTTLRNSRPASIISDRFLTKMKYADRYATASSLAGVTGCYLFNLNSVFDPDRTGFGHQPWGRDQLAALYHRYRVFAVSWRVSFFPTSNPATFVVVPINNEQSSNGQTISVTREQPRAISKLSSSDKPTIFTGRITLARLNGQTTSEYKGADRFQALNGSDPAELMTLQICSNPLLNTGSYAFEIQLTYHTEWFDPLPVGQS